MIAIIGEDKIYINQEVDNVKDFLISYAEYIYIDTKIFKILVKSNELTTSELVDYINDNCGYEENIQEIFEIKNKIY